MKTTEKTMLLYSVSCGLYEEDSLYPPYPNISDDYIEDLNKAIEIYNSITADSFDKKEVDDANNAGYSTYNKCILCVEMPVSIYEDWCLVDDNGLPLSKEQTQERVNDCVWHESVKFLDNIKDEVFEIKNGKIANLRNWTENEITN